MEELDEDDTMEAWMLARMRTGLRTAATACNGDEDIIGEMGGPGWRRRGPRLWEEDKMAGVGATRACKFMRWMAARGVAQWGDVTDSRDGTVMPWDR
eukprot:6623345-Prymnesium_polylepis.1